MSSATNPDATSSPLPRGRAFDRLVVRSLPFVPRKVVQRVAGRYLAGETLDDMASTVAELNAKGVMATVDLLGEDVTVEAQALVATSRYIALLDHIDAKSLQSNVSVKLTMLGLKLDESLCQNNLGQLAAHAKTHGNFVRIDMEDNTCTDPTLTIYRALRSKYDNIGVVLQSMLHRTAQDVTRLVALSNQGPRTNVRLVKGIYLEPPEIAFQDANEIRESYLYCLEKLFKGGCYVAIATHDEKLVEGATALVERLGIDKKDYEFQMLLGVLPALRRQLLAAGHRLRVYVPYGADWYAYSIRRLRENPTVARHVMRALFSLNKR